MNVALAGASPPPPSSAGPAVATRTTPQADAVSAQAPIRKDQRSNHLRRQALQPVQIAIRMLGDEDKLLLGQLKISRQTLLALNIKLLRREYGVRSFEADGAAPLRLAQPHDVRIENILRKLLHVLLKHPPGHRSRFIIGRQKQVHQRLLKIDGPRGEFVPWPRRAVQHKRRERGFKQGVGRWRGVDIMRLEMQIIVDEKVPELPSREECIPTSHKACVDLQSSVSGIRWRNVRHEANGTRNHPSLKQSSVFGSSSAGDRVNRCHPSIPAFRPLAGRIRPLPVARRSTAYDLPHAS